MRYEHEIRRAHNAPQIIFRALQYANSTPQGPAYVIASRETFEEQVPVLTSKPSQTYARNLGVEPIGLTPPAISMLSEVLIASERPFIVTSYCGRSPAGFNALKDFAQALSIPVHENAPICNNFPTTSFLHQGHQWNGGGQLPALAEADVVLVIDADVPWIPAQSKPRDDARVFHLDCDPLKDGTTLWSLPCEGRWRCDAEIALPQLTAAISASPTFGSAATKDRIMFRKGMLQARSQARKRRLRAAEQAVPDGNVTVPYTMARLRILAASRGISITGLNESTTNLGNVADHLHHERPLSLIGSGGGALGWYSGAAVGASMALRSLGRQNGDLLVAFVGDGTWLFGVPSCAYWMAHKYDTPYLTIVWNNSGWASPKNACLRLHPEKAAEAASAGGGVGEAMSTSIDPSPEFGKIAEGATAGNAWWRRVSRADEVDGVLGEAVRQVLEERRCALVEIVLPKV
jgi:acetolactate synthase-1/2/3 large subunit